jgi:Flp pilus assembly protein TadD/ribosomal protein L40E
MAVARIVCGECGADIPSGVAVCPKCGVSVELPAAAGKEGGQVCALCGYRNPSGATTCESCGAKLSGKDVSSVSRGPVSAKRQQPPPARVKGKAAGKKESSGLDVWQVVSGVAVVALIAVLVYVLWPHDQSPAARPAPSQQQATVSMAEIESLQQSVNADPSNTSARLRLANILHDNGMLPRAIENYAEYLKREPKNPDARVDLGICYDQLAIQDSSNAARYFALAVQEMQAVATSSPTHQPAAFNLGIVNLHMGNLEESNKWFKRAVELGRNTDLGVRAEKILQQHSFSQ